MTARPEGTVTLPLPAHFTLTFTLPGDSDDDERLIEIGRAGLHASEDRTRLIFAAVICGVGQIQGSIPVPVIGPG